MGCVALDPAYTVNKGRALRITVHASILSATRLMTKSFTDFFLDGICPNQRGKSKEEGTKGSRTDEHEETLLVCVRGAPSCYVS